MTEPRTDLPNAPSLEWNGKRWPIPELAPRELDIVWEPIIGLSKIIFEGADWTDHVGDTMVSLTREQHNQMLDVVYVGLTRAHRDLTREEFDDTPISGPELLTAFLLVRAQSLIYGRVSRVERSPQGEAPAGGDQTSSTLSPAPAGISETPATTGGNT